MGALETMDLDFTKPQQQRSSSDATLQPQIGKQRAGKGSNYIIYARAQAERNRAAPGAPVLVVEDDEDVRRLLERLLTLEGFTVRTAADSQQFVQEMRKGPLPCLILLDVELPRISGFRLLGLLRQEPQTSAIPVVMVTACSENKDLLQGLSLGADGYLSKPVSVDTLRAVIGKVLRRAA